MITSAANERIKDIRKLQTRKEREASGLFYIEGLRILAEAVAQGVKLETLIAAPDLLKIAFGQELLAQQRARGVPVLEVSADVFERMALKEGPQGLAAVARQQWSRLEDVCFAQPPGPGAQTWVALDSVADPGNLGTILRTHDAAGGLGVILLDQSTDPYDPSAMRASMGALFTQRLVRASFAEFARWKQSALAVVVGTSDKAAQDYHAYRYPAQTVLLMGSERQGLHEAALALCDAVVRIPMLGKSDSLNLAVAAAVTLYEIVNQRRENP
jgi:TrmH family RNA methyltransferase